MAQTLFNLLNVLPLPIWLGMILFPRTRYTQNLVMSYWYYMVLAGVYLLFLIVALLQNGLAFEFDAAREGLSSEWGLLAAWAHFIVLDLFAGVWIFRDAKYWGINPTWFVLLTLVIGPVGLGSYLLFRQRKSKTDPVRHLN
jgi:hypothetical protein